MPENDSSQTQGVTTADPEATPGEVLTQQTSGDNALQDTGFKYSEADGVPSYLIGKTAKEAAQITDQLYQQLLGQVNPQQQTQTAATPAVTTQVQSQPQPTQTVGSQSGYQRPTDDDFLSNPGQATEALGNYMYQQQIAPELQQTRVALAQQARQTARMLFKGDFDRWGPEIVAELNKLTPESQTPELIEAVVKMVKSNHIDELVNEKLDGKIQELQDSDTLRPGTTAVAGGTSLLPEDGIDLKSDKITYEFEFKGQKVKFGEWCRMMGVTSADIDDTLRKAKPHLTLSEARKEYFKEITGGKAVVAEA